MARGDRSADVNPADDVPEEKAHALEVIESLRSVIDPELGIDIVSLGLLYKVEVDGAEVKILMTLTVPGCPMHETITRDVTDTLERLPWVRNAHVDLTFDPPWGTERLSDDARSALGRV